MSTPIDHFADLPPSDELLAGEYVLGVLDADERRRVQARIAADASFARLVEQWDERLAPWSLEASEVAPSAHVWPRVRARLGWSPVTDAERVRLWDNARFWRGAAALAASVAAVSIGLRVALPPSSPSDPTIAEQAATRPVVVLARDDGQPAWIATLDATRGTVAMAPVPSPSDAAGRVNELWIIPAGRAPVSLGVVSNDRAHTINLSTAEKLALVAGATLAVTLEQKAGIPHNAPTGPIVAKGGVGQI